MAVILTHASVIVRLVTLTTLSNRPRVGGQLEFRGRQVLVAAGAEVDVLTQCAGILWYLDDVGNVKLNLWYSITVLAMDVTLKHKSVFNSSMQHSPVRQHTHIHHGLPSNKSKNKFLIL
jgi:hypothetical protein